MGHLNHLFQLYATYAKENPVIAGVMGLWLASATSFLLVKAPKHVVDKIDNFISHSIVISDANGATYRRATVRIANWLEEHRMKNWTRSFALYGRGDDIRLVGGGGRHVFIYKNRIGTATRTEEESKSATFSDQRLIVRYTIKLYGFSSKVLHELMDDILTIDTSAIPTMPVKIITMRKDTSDARMLKLNDARIVMHDKLRENLFGSLKNYMASEQWYRDRALSYKYTIMLYGPPGTGKTSIIRCIATMLNYEIVTLSLDTMLAGELSSICGSYGAKTLFILEDLDGSPCVLARRGMAFDPAYEGPFADDLTGDGIARGVGLSELLNILDGVVTNDSQVFILSTNQIGKMDKAIMRPGRVDLCLEVPNLEPKHIGEYMRMMYFDYDGLEEALEYIAASLTTEEVPGSMLYGTYLDHKHDPVGFAHSITDKVKAKHKAEAPQLSLVAS